MSSIAMGFNATTAGSQPYIPIQDATAVRTLASLLASPRSLSWPPAWPPPLPPLACPRPPRPLGAVPRPPDSLLSARAMRSLPAAPLPLSLLSPLNCLLRPVLLPSPTTPSPPRPPMPASRSWTNSLGLGLRMGRALSCSLPLAAGEVGLLGAGRALRASLPGPCTWLLAASTILLALSPLLLATAQRRSAGSTTAVPHTGKLRPPGGGLAATRLLGLREPPAHSVLLQLGLRCSI